MSLCSFPFAKITFIFKKILQSLHYISFESGQIGLNWNVSCWGGSLSFISHKTWLNKYSAIKGHFGVRAWLVMSLNLSLVLLMTPNCSRGRKHPGKPPHPWCYLCYLFPHFLSAASGAAAITIAIGFIQKKWFVVVVSQRRIWRRDCVSRGRFGAQWMEAE